MNTELESPYVDDEGNYLVVASILYFENTGKFPWDDIDLRDAIPVRETNDTSFKSPKELLTHLQKLRTECGAIKARLADNSIMSLDAQMPKNLEKLSSTQLLNEALTVARLLFEAYRNQYDLLYCQKPAVFDSWLVKLAHYISKYRLYPSFLRECEVLIQRESYIIPGTKTIGVYYSAPVIPKGEKRRTVRILKDCVVLKVSEPHFGSQS